MYRSAAIGLVACIVSGAFAVGDEYFPVKVPPLSRYEPYVKVAPPTPISGETATITLTMGMHANECIPEYSSIKYVITQSPATAPSPLYDIHIFYTEKWPSQDACPSQPTAFGLSVPIAEGDLGEGKYAIYDGDLIIGRFEVAPPATISGTVTDDPGPHKRPVRPIANAKVYLQKKMQLIIDDPDIMLPLPLYKKDSEPAPLYDNYYVAVDSARSASDGGYRFSGVRAGDYRLAATARGFVTEASHVCISGDTTIDFMLDADIDTGSAETIIVDGVAFTVRTNRSSYSPADSLRISYAVANGSMATVRFDFTSGCQFDMTLGSGNDVLWYRYLNHRACTEALSAIILAPGESTTFSFPSMSPHSLFAAGAPPADSVLRVRAFMAGYPESAVSTDVTLARADIVSGKERSGPARSSVRFAARRDGASLTIDRAQTVHIDAFLPSGRRIDALSRVAKLRAGDHVLPFSAHEIAAPVVLFRVRGDHFSLTRTVIMTPGRP
jgi:hypothetical protein